MGRFLLGSTVVMLFPEGPLHFNPAGSRAAGAARRSDGRPRAGPVAAMRAVFVDANPALRALAEAIGPRVLPQFELAFGDADIVAEALPTALAGAPIAVIDHTSLPTDVAARCDGLRDVVFLGTGARSYMDPEALAAIGVTVHLIKGYGDTAVAECAIGLLFDAARKFAAMDRAMRDGRWLRSEGTQLAGKTLGLIGYGGIAAEVARMAIGIGMKVIAWNRTARAAAPGVELVAIERLLAESDAVSLHLLLTDETRGFLSPARIAAMRRGALLVNTARARRRSGDGRGVALGQIGHAALDVFTVEPLPPGHVLTTLANVDALGALGLSHAGSEHPPDRGGVRALRADRGTQCRVRTTCFGNRPMIFDAIRESHDLQPDLCRKLTASRGDMAARQLLFLQLKVELMAHAAAEERHLYVELLMEDGGLDASRHALHEHHEVDELLDDLSVRNKKQAGWIATAKKLSFKVRHHLKEEESKFFQLAGRLLSETKKKQLARKYTKEIVRMRKHYADEYATVAVAATTGLVTPAKRGAAKPATSGKASAGAKLRGKSEPRRTR